MTAGLRYILTVVTGEEADRWFGIWATDGQIALSI